MQKLTINGLWIQFVEPLRELAPFSTHGNLWGQEGPAATYGRLPAMMRESASQADYVVYSYATPIAWHLPTVQEVKVTGYAKPISASDFPFATGTWVFPPLKYSVTTSKAQGRILTALGSLGFRYDD
jgi:hypothetical protein